jgi:cell wall-associated NlpC family hydrolase
VNPALLACAIPPLALAGVLLVVGGAGANAEPVAVYGCGGAGTGQTVAGVRLDAEQMQNGQTVVQVTAGRHLPAFAAIAAVDTAYTESTLHNSTVESDHDSEGIFQQRVSIYTKAVADDPVKATNAFLDRLENVPNWQSQPVDVDAQTVQISQHPERYSGNVALAQQLVGQLWPAAAAASGPTATSSSGSPSSPAPSVSPPPICAGGGGAGPIVGPTGNNVAGTTTIPTGFVITGSAAAHQAVQFALAQLGEPYVFGAAGPDSWDCSGLTMGAWAVAGVALPHYTSGPDSPDWQVTRGTPEPTDLSQAVGGDLVFIPGSDGTAAAPGHVGMVAGYVDKSDGRHLYLIQAPETGVPVELTEATEWRGQIVDVRHIK